MDVGEGKEKEWGYVNERKRMERGSEREREGGRERECLIYLVGGMVAQEKERHKNPL